MFHRLLPTTLGVFLSLSVGCVLQEGPGVEDGSGSASSGGGGAGASALAVRNASSQSICYVNISPASSSEWGPDRLGGSEVITPGAQRGWELPSGSYDVRLQDCNHTTMLDRRGVVVAGSGIMLTYQ